MFFFQVASVMVKDEKYSVKDTMPVKIIFAHYMKCQE